MSCCSCRHCSGSWAWAEVLVRSRLDELIQIFRIIKLRYQIHRLTQALRLRSDVQTQQIKAWMSIAVEGNRTREVIAILMGEPGVASLMDTNGRWDLLAELRADHLQDLAKVLERIRLLKGISNTETSIHLETYRFT
jgi:Lrp/AsnC ligand binding domain